ncbi:NADPH-dependent FMN reductase [Brumicola pallidula]|jgi:NAD(P)H-dependent FMN reductase|uniref:NADPH-dependent FMN reductase n=1 Tax=Brumicola pallidula DSM 14239 = ACAM 615 TaxID=1121922 RepID=K6ZGE8_9ALTE|nr:NAD(P)H-dependent oxidoreductase [Glaciecola pallidula]GAC29422.1 NADPH-dependent FMN reductase [Glaciecola pallidula DSM 14239 = ACAM 615]
MKVIAFAATNHSKSINKQLVEYAASLLTKVEVEIIDLNHYELPLYGQDKEEELGHPKLAKAFIEKIANSDGIIISFAEHNGSYTVAYKNIFDWCSRIEPKVYQKKPMVLLATSSGSAGASSVLTTAVQSSPYFDGEVKASLSIPSFFDNFDSKKQKLKHGELDEKLRDAVSHLNLLSDNHSK